MSKTTFLGYVPSLKSKHEATIVGHKAIESKGGSIRYTLQGEYQGRKTLPKTVSKADFEGIYGFDAKEAEAVIIHGKKKMHPSVKTPLRTVVAHKIGVEDKDGFIPTYIDAGDFKDGITLSEGLFENHAESVLVVGRKDDGSQEVAGHVKGVADKEGFTPSKIQTYDDSIFDRQEIDVKSLKGNLVNHAETVVGNPSPASVEPPAPSEKPFPQEPSNENFSAEDYGWVITHKDSGLRTDSFRTKSQAEKYRDELKQNKTLRTGMKIVKANSNDEPITPNILNYLDVKEAEEAEFYQIEIKYNMEDGWEMLRVWKDEEEAISAYYDIRYEHPEVRLLGVDEDGDKDVIYIQRNYDLEVKEAFGFGKDEEEEKEEPKTQEFTVVLQEGDKLELTDVEEEQAAPDDEKTEKEAESPKTRTFIVSSVDYETDGEELDLPQDFTFTLDEHDTADLEGSTDMQEIADLLVDNISDETDLLVQGFYFQEKMPDGTLVDLDAETYEAVQAKVTRPVKEDETEDDEESEGLSTLAKVGLGVGALAVGAAIFGAEGEYPQEFLDEFYDFDSNPTADTQDEETLAIAYAAWLESKRNEENIPYQAETDYTEIYGAFSIDKDDEGWLEMYDAYLEYEDEPQGMTLEEYKKWIIEAREEDYQMQVKYEQRLKDEGRDMDGNPIKGAETFEAEKVYRNMPTDPDIPTILIDGPFGKEMWAFYDESNYDNGFKHDPKAYQNEDGEMCAQIGCFGDISLEYARSSRGYRYCSDCWEMSSFTKRGYHAETSNENFEAEGMTHDEQEKHYNELHPLERELVNIWETTYELGTTRGYYHEILSDYGVRGLNRPTWNDNPNHSSNWPTNSIWPTDIKGFWDSSYNEWRDSMVKNESRFKSLPLLQVSLPKNAETSNENFEAGNMMVKLQEVDGEAPYYNCPYCRNELTVLGGKGGIVAVCENESRCNGLEIPRQYLDDYEKYHWYVNERSSAENFSAEGDMKTCGNCGGESDADNFNECVYCSKQMCNQCGDYNGDCTNCGVAYCYDDSGCGDCGEVCKDCECDCNSMEAESKNLKMALGITAVGIGLAAVLGKEKIKTLFDRFGL